MKASITLSSGVVALVTGPSSNRTTKEFCLDTGGKVLHLHADGTAVQVCYGLRSTGTTLRVHGDTFDKRYAALLACIRRESIYQRATALQLQRDESSVGVAI